MFNRVHNIVFLLFSLSPTRYWLRSLRRKNYVRCAIHTSYYKRALDLHRVTLVYEYVSIARRRLAGVVYISGGATTRTAFPRVGGVCGKIVFLFGRTKKSVRPTIWARHVRGHFARTALKRGAKSIQGTRCVQVGYSLSRVTAADVIYIRWRRRRCIRTVPTTKNI